MKQVSKEEFIKRFIDHMIKRVGNTDSEGNDVRKYAEEVAPTYFDDLDDEDIESPEDAAETDLSYWEN